MTRFIAFQPRVASKTFGFAEAFAQTLLHGERRVNGFSPDFPNADALDEVVGTFQIVRVLAVVLEKERCSLKSFFGGFDSDKQVCFANFLSCCAANDHLPCAFLPNQADVFHGGFSAIARTADGAHFYFGRSEKVFEAAFEFDAGLRGILHTEATEICADARFHHAHAFCVGLAARHAEVSPDFWQIRFFHAEEIDALAACDFHHRYFVFVGDVGNAAEFCCGSYSATHAGNHRESSVFLNVGVNAIVYVARGTVLVMIAAPDHVHHVAESGFTNFAAQAVAIYVEDLLDRKNALAADDVAEFLFAIREALAQNAFRFLLKFRDDGFEELLAVFCTTAATGGGARTFFQLRQGIHAFAMDCFDDRALGDANAAADDFGVRHGRHVEPQIFRRGWEEKLTPVRRKVFLCAEPIHVAMAVGRVADENGARKSSVAQSQLFVDTKRGIFVTDDVDAGRLVGEISRGENIHPHDFEFCGGDGTFEARALVAGNCCSENPALFEQRSHKAVARAVVLDAFADSKNVRIRRLHEIVDDDAAIDVKPGFPGQLDIWTNSRGHNDQIGFDAGAVFERDAFDLFAAANCGGAALQ